MRSGDGYRQVGSFESGRVAAVDVGDDAIAVALEDRVELVRGRDRTAIDHGDRIDDVALADRVLVLSDGELATYSREGERVWNQPVADVDAIAAIPERGCCALLGPDRLRAVDVETGRERFDVERPRPGADDQIRATPDGFLIATWSFLTCVDADGAIVFDRDLSAVVRSVGYCEETGAIVAALQSDRLVGLDDATGDRRWRTELEATHVAPRGESTVLVGTSGGIRAVGPDGTTTSAAGLSGGDVYAAADGSLVCAVRDGTVSTYVHASDRLEATIATESVGVGGTIDLRVTNRAESERTAEIALSIDGCSLSPSERQISVGPGETELVDFPVASVRVEGQTEVEIVVDGSSARSEPITLEDAASGTLAVETDLEPSAVDDGVAELTVTVENVGGVPLDEVRLLETEDGTDGVAPGERWTETVTRPYEPGRRVSVGLEVVRGDRRREYAPTCTLPAAPTIDVDATDEALRATVAVDDVTVRDRLVIEMPGAGRVRSPVTIDGDELLLVVPQYESGTARLGFDAIDVDERVRVSGSGPFATPGAGRSDRGSGRRRDRSSRTETRAESAASRDADSATLEDGRPSASDSGPTATESAAADTPRLRSDNARADADSGDDTAADGSSLSLTREVSDPSPILGRAVRDRLVVDHGGETPVQASVVADGETISIGRLEPGETVPVERTVGAVSTDGLVLSDASLEVAGTVADRVSERRLPVSTDGVVVRARADPNDGSIVAEIENGDDRRCRLFGLAVDAYDCQTSIDAVLGIDETTTVTATPASPPADRALEGPVSLSLTVRYDDGSEETIEALAGVSAVPAPQSPRDDADAPADADATGPEADAAVDADAASLDDPLLTAEISPETKVAGEYGSVVLVFENESDRPLSDVSVSAAGEPINEMFYSEARREVLEAGDWIEHFVDLEAGIEKPTFEATVRYAVDGTEREYTVRASGPAVAEEAQWTDDHLDAWSVERIDDGEGAGDGAATADADAPGASRSGSDSDADTAATERQSSLSTSFRSE